MNDTEQIILDAWESRRDLKPHNAPAELREAIADALDALDSGRRRVAEPDAGAPGGWKVNQWLKMAVLLSFRIEDNRIIRGGFSNYYDKIPLKFGDYDSEDFARGGFRVAPPALVRRGAHIGADVILMPSYVNIGAFVGAGTMVDTWATVGSCAQIGSHVHLSGGVGIGGVLEPLQAAPTIIEDNCFIGARSEIVEGVLVGKGAVISMGVFIGQSTRILNRASGEVSYGRVPPGAVVVSGSMPAADGSHSLYCAVIVKTVDEKTRAKVGINELLRGE
ncbi:MAG: 2,3,4,5-tetrahydropyridine-2,6-dicarboxylate N-succinyltransferase [Gammaproteobacteria bacterium]|nr:2,3,4,5-tetrahydropyridine-2,6-dicarboxylate N-succinyltransferase [Gammaproteobacteria bacterium]MDD9855283.1 2,3,4,5-tetrahydropyridine-2,6-dicarboxylate N-succinyltransferase [Gammaproteobacteria bacterium]